MQGHDPQTVSMKWSVTFRQQQQNCCPPGKYWIVRTCTVEADTVEQAQQELLRSWRYNNKIEIKNVVELEEDDK
jgi:hypothetical protein